LYVILAYDVGVERISNVRTFLKQYLNWVQNSVFEGELTEAEFMSVEQGLKERINPVLDFIIIYRLASNKFLETTEMGTPKAETGTIL